MQSDLCEAHSQLSDYLEQRDNMERDLEFAVENADAGLILDIQDKLARLSVHIHAQRSRVLRLQKSQDVFERSIVATERDALEAELILATQDYARAVEVAADKHVAMQLIQVKLYGKDSLIESYREKINDETAQLRSHLANFKTLSLLPASERAAEL